MLKSLELKAELESLTNSINQKISEKQDASAEQEKLASLITEYKNALADESKAKVSIEKGEKKMDKKLMNKAVKSFLLGIENEETKQFFDDAAGNNGAVTADGGALIPEETLALAENNAVAPDLRAITTVIPVGTRTGKVPAIDYGQEMELTDFDENNAITEKKAVFTSVPYTLASKGAIIPVSRELLMDANTDVLAVIAKLFNTVYAKTVTKSIVTAASAGASPVTVTSLASKAGLDAVKKAVIGLPFDSANSASIVVNQNTFAALATVADKNDNYLLTRDANGATIRQIEGRPVIVVDNAALADNTAVVGNFAAIYHIAYPDLEVASSEEAGFAKNSVLVRAICRFVDINTYAKAFAVVKQGA